MGNRSRSRGADRARAARRGRVSVIAGAVAAAVLALAACESEPSSAQGKAAEEKGATVVAPGLPGEKASRIPADEVAEALPDDTPNAADFAYTQMMIEHHKQALTMTALVPSRAGAISVKRLAERVSAAQGPEIGGMEGWLEINAKHRPKGGDHHGDHAHGAMPGMATPAQLAQLRAAKGAAFDALFLKLMITHHEGAVTMATEALTKGNNVRVEEMASEVIAQQSAEVARMRAL
ncbi:DUF305 domain-containing protein [Streptomyces sp. NPDC057638]|uniref:DUF305 domain-containing protein n=1 Tax=Streptomyces sp. NPDC057638 TaxID=3346190 RepID=UPI0036CF602A